MKKNKIPEANKRFLEIISFYNYTGYRLSKEVTVITESKLTHIRSGRNKLSNDMLNAIIEKFPNVNYNWLLTGNGEMLVKDTKIESLSIEDIIKSLNDRAQEDLDNNETLQLFLVKQYETRHMKKIIESIKELEKSKLKK